MTVDVKAMVPFFMGVFFSLMLADRGGLLFGVGFLVAVTLVTAVVNRFIVKNGSSGS